MKIAVAGTGYVGLSLATLLSSKNEVCAYDIVAEKVRKINERISPIKDKEIEEYFATKKLNLTATLDYKEAFSKADFVIISTPTNYDEDKNYFDTSSVEDIIQKVILMNIDTTMVVKSTIPVGFIENIKKKYKINNIMFSPEFLREGKALYDNLHPSRIIVGERSKKAEIFANLLKDCSLDENTPVLFMNSTEAEAVKLFANTYLALRVSYFNELDTYAELKGLNTKDIIDGICLDPRIGSHYNNPSFGYGGYCLPKDTKNLAWFSDSLHLIRAVIDSNEARKKRIATKIIHSQKSVGVYKLNMKYNSDNLRGSALLDIIKILLEDNVFVAICDPDNEEIIKDKLQVSWVSTLEELDEKCDIILSNRIYPELCRYIDKVYTRDIFERD